MSKLDVFAGEKATSTSREEVYSVEFNWQSAGCCGNLCLRLGEKLLPIELPEGFPVTPLKLKEEVVEVYGTKQVFTLVSTPNRTPMNAELTLDISGITVPFQLMIGGAQLLGGLQVESRQPVYGADGKLLWEIVTPVFSEFEQAVLRGDPCRPNCRWTSLIQSRLEYPWELVQVEIPAHGLYIIHHYRRRVDYNWASFHCENDVWTFKRNDVDTQNEPKVVRLKIYQEGD